MQFPANLKNLDYKRFGSVNKYSTLVLIYRSIGLRDVRDFHSKYVETGAKDNSVF